MDTAARQVCLNAGGDTPIRGDYVGSSGQVLRDCVTALDRMIWATFISKWPNFFFANAPTQLRRASSWNWASCAVQLRRVY